MQNIEGLIRKAIDEYSMIDENDKIAIALSGGKDSMTILYLLKNLQRYYPKKFELMAISVNPGFENFDVDLLQKACDEVKVKLEVVNSDIKQIVFEERKEKNPCSLCANLRRGILNSTAKKYGCNKIAIGHNQDDVLETLLMNMIYAGNLSTFAPKSYMDRSDMTVIRPLIYVEEKSTRNFVKKKQIEIMPKVCPQDGNTTREYALNLIKEFETKNPHFKEGLLGAIKRSKLSGW